MIQKTAIWATERIVSAWLRYLRFHQRGKAPARCGYPRCHRDWHDHFTDVRLCKKHHPAYEVGAIERALQSL